MRLVAALIGLAVAAALALSGALDGLERSSIDARFAVRGDQPTPDMLVVAIDESSLNRIGRWPLDRRRHAEAVDRLAEAGAKLIVYDVQFTERSPDPRADLALYRAIGRAGGAVLATSASAAAGQTLVLGGDENLRRVDAAAGAANLRADPGGVIRRYGRTVGRLPSLAAVTYERLRGRPLSGAGFGDGGRALIDFGGPPATIASISFADLLDGAVDPARLRDRIVVVGATAPSLQDFHPTSVGGGREMSGAEIQANAIRTALRGNPLRPTAGWIGVLAFVALAAAPWALMRRHPLTGLALAAATAAGYAVLAQLLFDGGDVLPLAAPLAALVLTCAAELAASYLAAANERTLQARVSERLQSEVDARTAQLRETQLEIVRRLAQAAERRDDETGAHLERIGRMTQRLAIEAGLPAGEADLIRHASAMHDVGKIGIPDSVLRKPGKLTDVEWKVMRTHPEMGARILADSSSELVQLAEEIARTHHERWDGSGYPSGLAGEAIPLSGRICAVCDVFDALTSRRPYKHAWPVDEALAEIRRLEGVHFDPRLAELFIELVERGEITASPAEA